MSVTSTSIIDDNPASYGSKGQSWHPAFVEYMKSIVTHPSYNGMPDALNADGKIQWEAPSNRSGGQYKDTHHKRRDWWRVKARSCGISDAEDQWISRVAKLIHPTKEKPCKRCGQVLRIAYVYPSALFVRRCNGLFGEDHIPSRLEEVSVYVERLVDEVGDHVMDNFPVLFATGEIKPPILGRSKDSWLNWIEDVFVPSEPTLLSPGAMSNAPDRFDGFHSFNRCCRSQADKGRHKENLQSYTTDRRVFEFWSDGDWIAADRMMGLVRAKFSEHLTADGGEGPPSADHIGPVSLGFAHRPEFRLLSRAANSAKNNRMTFWDVSHLRSTEKEKTKIVSWYAEPVWDLLKQKVVDEETALRLSKIMRDNQRVAMSLLSSIFKEGYVTFLACLLELHYADSMVEFSGLAIKDYLTVFGSLQKTERVTKYAAEQKARRLRIGFEALRSYSTKSNRHGSRIEPLVLSNKLQEVFATLHSESNEMHQTDQKLRAILVGAGTLDLDAKLRSICVSLPRLEDVSAFVAAKAKLKSVMSETAQELSTMWDDERYTRFEITVEE